MRGLLLCALLLACASALVIPVNKHYVQKKSVRVLKAGPTGGHGIFPLQGDIDRYAEFFVNITLGTPPQTIRVQVDSGSTDLVVFGTDCDGCPKLANITDFNLGKSKSGSPIDCQDDEYDCDVNNCWNDDYCPLDIQYGGGGEVQGYAALDTFAIGNLTTRVSFGIIEELSGAFENSGIDGCWGFAYDQLSSWGDGAVIDHLAFNLKMYDSFSLCLRPDNAIMDIGVNYQTDTSFQWTKIVSQDWFSIEAADFSVNGTSLGLSHGTLNDNGVIVDSGTTLVILPEKVMAAVTAKLTALCAKNPELPGVCNFTKGQSLFDGYCYPMTTEQVDLFPSVSITLEGTSQLVMEPQAYLWQGTGTAGVYCLGFQTIKGQDLPLILGDILLQNYHVVFDKEKSKVGFGPLSGCPTL